MISILRRLRQNLIIICIILGVLCLKNYTNSAILAQVNEVTIGPYLGQYKTLESALAAVPDGGTINIVYKPESYLFDNIVINKNVTIKGISNSSGSLPTVYFNSQESPAVQVNSPNYFVIENINFVSSYGKTLIENFTPYLTVNNITTTHCIPIVLKDPINNEQMEILIHNCDFSVFTPNIELDSTVSGNITFNNNTFSDVSLFITNNGADIQLSNNVFDSSGLKILPSSSGPINVSENTFMGYTCKINSSSSGDLNFYNNKFLASNSYITNSDTNNTLVLDYNWWGSIDGPLGSNNTFNFQGAVEYDNWALNQDFSSYRMPYKISGNALLKNSYSHEDIRVDLIHESEIISTYFTDLEGYFNFNDVYTGNYTLTFHHDKYNTVTKEVYLSSEDATVNVELEYSIGLFDFNDDNEVNEYDMELIVNNFGLSKESPLWNEKYDINNNEQIDILDLIIALRYRGNW